MAGSYVIKPAKGKTRSVVRIADSLGISTKVAPRDLIRGCDGVTRITDEKACILVSSDLSVEEQHLTVAHELAHIFLGHFIGIDDERFKVPCEQAEFEAESLGFIMYNFLYGIDGGRKARTN